MPLELLSDIEKACEEHGFTLSNLRCKDEIKHENLRQELFITIKKNTYKGEKKYGI